MFNSILKVGDKYFFIQMGVPILYTFKKYFVWLKLYYFIILLLIITYYSTCKSLSLLHF